MWKLRKKEKVEECLGLLFVVKIKYPRLDDL
jgi:hypothetical protein